MKKARLLALGLAAPLAFIAAVAHAEAERAMPGRLLDDNELSQVHAAGLPDPSLQRLAAGVPLAALELPMAQLNTQDLSSSIDRQQAMAQLRLASATTQGSLGLMQVASLPTLVTPLAPLFLPTLALPFPFFIAPPPKKPEQPGGH